MTPHITFRVAPTLDSAADAADSVDTIVVPLPEGAESCAPPFAEIAQQLLRAKDLPLKPMDVLVHHGNRRTVFIGLPKTPDVDAWRRIGAMVVRRLRKSRSIAFMDCSGEGRTQALSEGVLTGVFATDLYKTPAASSLLETVLFVGGASEQVERGRIIGESINWARELILEPANYKPPRRVAERAAEMAAVVGLKADVLDETGIKALKMGGLLGISRGSEEPPRVVVLRYFGDPASTRLLAFVGKGVTFDTGGISLKPADGMEKMKYDMAGGASAMAALRSLALLKAQVNCMAIVPLTENMPGGRAVKPGDVLKTMSGKTIEVINTDAEGRVILADALHYAKELGATHIVDLATLTGACRIALGSIRVAVLGNSQPFINAWIGAAQRVSEKMWQLPMDDEYRDMIKSPIADVANSGGRGAGAITGAKFLQEFVGDVPWVHLDIAGTAWNDDDKPHMSRGPSGVAIRSLVEFASGFKNIDA